MAFKKTQAAPAAASEAVKVNARPAPKPKSSGEQIKLEPLTGKLCALKVVDRRSVDTKFGARNMSDTVLIPSGADEPLYGVLFASYFQDLEIGEWYIGRIAKSEKGTWFMSAPTATDQREINSLMPIMAGVDESDEVVPF